MALLMPSLKQLADKHPLLSYELHTSSESDNLAGCDADIVVLATRQPPQHVIGKLIGSMFFALFTGANSSVKTWRMQYLGAGRKELVQLAWPLEEFQTELWPLTHPEIRHLLRVLIVFSYLSQTLKLN